MAFNEDVVEQGMIRSFIDSYSSILESIMSNPDAPLQSIQFDVARNRNLLLAGQQQNVSGEEAENPKTRNTQEKETLLASRRATLQARAAKLSPFKKDALNKKLNRFLGPSST